MAQVRRFRQQVALKMPTPERVNREQKTIDHKNPGEEEMPEPAHREPLRAGEGGPSRKAALGHLAVDIRSAEPARRVEARSSDLRDALEMALRILLGGQPQRGMI